MSRRKLNDFKTSALAAREMRPRESRHGRPIVGSDGPYWKPAVVSRERKVTTNKSTGLLEVHYIETVISTRRPMTFEEIQKYRNSIKRATEPTTPGGKKNVSEKTTGPKPAVRPTRGSK
jgi:hypothetical protein